ncbi:hypothetical protein RSAG8_08991, partial [Rhizoctonia solani AG-8 WAC10335]
MLVDPSHQNKNREPLSDQRLTRGNNINAPQNSDLGDQNPKYGVLAIDNLLVLHGGRHGKEDRRNIHFQGKGQYESTGRDARAQYSASRYKFGLDSPDSEDSLRCSREFCEAGGGYRDK